MTKPQIDLKGGHGTGREPEARVSPPRGSTITFERSRPRPTGRMVGTQAVPMQETNLIDINELARRLSIPKGTLYNWVYLRRIPFVKLGRALRFNPKEIERIVRSSSTLEVAGRR
jgi:excisionase family DNA binding protein